MAQFWVPYDSPMATYIGDDVLAFCLHYRTGRQKSFSFGKYDEPSAMVLSQYWTERMECFFCRMDERDQGQGYRFTEADTEDVPQPSPELVACLEEKPANHPAQGALRQLRNLFPKNPNA